MSSTDKDKKNVIYTDVEKPIAWLVVELHTRGAAPYFVHRKDGDPTTVEYWRNLGRFPPEDLAVTPLYRGTTKNLKLFMG